MWSGSIPFIFFSSRRRHTRYWRTGVQTCALPIFVGRRVEVHDQLAVLERVLAEDPDPPVLDLDDVVAGARVAAQARRRGGPPVHDKHVLELPRVRHMLVPGEDEVHLRVRQQLQPVPSVGDYIPFPPGAGDRDQMVVDHEYLELTLRLGEGLMYKVVVLAPYPPIVEVRLRGVYRDHNRILEPHHRVPVPEEPLEMNVTHVARIVVAGDDHYTLAAEPLDVPRRRLELLPVAGVGKVARDHDGRRVHVVDL